MVSSDVNFGMYVKVAGELGVVINEKKSDFDLSGVCEVALISGIRKFVAYSELEMADRSHNPLYETLSDKEIFFETKLNEYISPIAISLQGIRANLNELVNIKKKELEYCNVSGYNELYKKRNI